MAEQRRWEALGEFQSFGNAALGGGVSGDVWGWVWAESEATCGLSVFPGHWKGFERKGGGRRLSAQKAAALQSYALLQGSHVSKKHQGAHLPAVHLISPHHCLMCQIAPD
ncbi:unnamed protein product [Symbiodinium natans]|uniref:Uncharacterized protein n=1 Tax=Symbiodinium natans TaxID=878477 RepID=A0A812UXA5_9DINO|nr:unnamed protein product [Symbiodinium natans]